MKAARLFLSKYLKANIQIVTIEPLLFQKALSVLYIGSLRKDCSNLQVQSFIKGLIITLSLACVTAGSLYCVLLFYLSLALLIIMMASNQNFKGYRWDGLPHESEDSAYGRWTQSFMDSIDWNALCLYASKLNDGVKSAIDPKFTMGGRHMVRIINFRGGERWIARLRMTTSMDDDEQYRLVQREVDCIQLVRERTSVPVPAVYGYVASAQNTIGAPFILMECLYGNVGMDLNHDFIPSQHKQRFYAEMARFQVCELSMQSCLYSFDT